MRAFVITLLFLSAAICEASTLKELLQQKGQNYLYLESHYSHLVSLAQINHKLEFCDAVKASYTPLVKILEDDNSLIYALRLANNHDYFDYAITLEENSPSPLFAYYMYMDICQDAAYNPIQSLDALKYNVINIDFLKTTHALWMEAQSL